MSNVETFDLRRSASQASVKPRTPMSVSSVPEIRSIKKRSSKRRRHKSTSSSEPKCREPNCEICRILKEDMEWVTTKQAKEEEDKAIERFSLNRIGLNPDMYRFDRKASQLDGTINMLSQILDERLQAERYRDAREISQIVRDLIAKRQRADALLLERRANLTNLERAQELKNEYDHLIFSAVDMSKIRKHLTDKQAAAISNLRHF